MTQKVSFDLEVFIAYTAIMVLIVVAVLYLCCIVGCNRSKDITEFQVSAKNPAHVLTIRTRTDNANQLMDHLLDRVLIQMDPESAVEPAAEPGEDPGDEPGEQPVDGFDSGYISESNLNVVTIASIHRSAVPSPLADEDETSDFSPQPSDASQSLSSSPGSEEEEQYQESQM